MTIREPGDDFNTFEVVKGNMPAVKDGKTWLRHKIHTQAAQIDLMVLSGKYSEREMAEQIDEKFPPNKNIQTRIQRVRDHLGHLQNGDPRGDWHNIEPHRLKLKEMATKLMFDID